MKECPLQIFRQGRIFARVNRHLALLLLAIGAHFPAYSYESDVHYGLTRWLAEKSGFSEWQSHLIATGNFQVDSGSMSTLALLPEYACIVKNDLVARQIQNQHYPSNLKVPADPHDRGVEPGGPAAREAIAKTLTQAKGHEAQYLRLFGAALHPLQDSWAHAGVPELAKFGPITCDARLAAIPAARANEGAHAADLTYLLAREALAMAKATYDELVAFPAVNGEKRTAQDWSLLEPQVRMFVEARTKTTKHEWFVKQGIVDTGFLEGTTLPDGPNPGPLRFDGRQLPPLTSVSSTQYDVPLAVREFFDQLIVHWLGDEKIETVVSQFAQVQIGKPKGGFALASRAAQLTTHLKLWKFRDHGTWARLAHLTRPFTASEIVQVNDYSKKPSAGLEMDAKQAVFPLVSRNPQPSPLLPYILHMLPNEPTSGPRAVAILRLKHAPRDTIGLIAERTSSGWKLVELVSVVDQ